MKLIRAHLLVEFLLLFSVLTSNIYALPKYGASELKSSDKAYTLKLVDTSDRWTYELKIFRNNIELAHYPFEGELVDAYWSPSLKFVAINNNNAHGGIYVWIISLTNGTVITSHGVVKNISYDRYSDDEYFADLPQAGDTKLRKMYPRVDYDQLREGYTSVVYGWKSGDRMLMFHELPFENFYPEKNLIIQAYTTSQITEKTITLEDTSFRKVKNQPYEPMPLEIKKTINFMD